MNNKWYWFFKSILIGPALRVYNRPEIEGLENIPTQGPAILASNHQAVMDSFYLPLLCPRQITFPAKQEYFTGTGLTGAIQRFFVTSVGQIPLDRTSGDAGQVLMNAGTGVLDKGDLFGIYPEGTRSPDGRIYRGRTGMARLALKTGVPVVPVAMIGSRDANPIGTVVPRPAKVRIRIGEAIDPLAFVKEKGLDPEGREVPRALTDYVMHELARLTGQDYVDLYASDVKKALEAGEGLPEA
ncbi:lysophospholipid acyltransferase family protein [Corynebacterium vitaeruminis]|uniref:lysophospholipid acyltransferase family protein n=1 Tax=Corynebacterium vitaeruminis TaxID=38305 RepID=UPI00054D23F6|nr:lysophospholipid acyltransferase family protein [Corynebacterium vitaeruminis]